MKQKNLNGGYKTMKSKTLAFKIIDNSPYVTEDVAKTIKYLEDIVINEHTLKKLNTGELVQNINRLLQTTMVLSVYKKPCLRMVNLYQKLIDKQNSPLGSLSRKEHLTLELIEELIADTGLDKIKFDRKDYWEDYE